MPGHPNEQRPVVAVIGRPPVLGGGHQVFQVCLYRFKVEFLERFSVLEVLVHRTDIAGVLVENIHTQLVWPPVVN